MSRTEPDPNGMRVDHHASRTTITRRDLLALAGTGALLSGLDTVGDVAAAEPGLSFLVVGDWGKPNRRDEAKVVAARMATTAASEGVRFVISTGDNFYPSGVTGVDDPKWQSAFETVYDAPQLMCPWYPVLGNHDYDGNTQAQVLYSARSSRWKMEARYYARSEPLSGGRVADFFFIDTEPLDDESLYSRWVRREAAVQAQLDWLDKGLAASRATWKIVVGHHTIYSGGQHGSTRELVAAIKPLLERHGVQAYINGHDHDLQHVVVDGVNYLTSGAGCETRNTKAIEGTLFAAAKLGFMSVKLGPRAMAISFIGADGQELYAARIPQTA